MTTRPVPVIRDLDGDDIRAILGRNNVGRLVFDWNGRLDIRPMHYVHHRGRIYGRTTAGAKFTDGVRSGAPVVFEVDEIESVFRWRSVIVRGVFDVLPPDGSEVEEREVASRLLRRVVKQTFLPNDPVPERDLVFRILADAVTGRASS